VPGKRRPRAKVRFEAYVSPALYERLIAVREAEKRTLSEVAGALILLGTGVWRRLRDRPEILKTFVYEDKAELLLLADFQLTAEIRDVMDEAGEAVIARDRKRRAEELKERSVFYK